MVDFQYAKGRIEESIDFISNEIEEFEKDYAAKDWKEYKQDNKLQKLIDRTVENIVIVHRPLATLLRGTEHAERKVVSVAGERPATEKSFAPSGGLKPIQEQKFHKPISPARLSLFVLRPLRAKQK